MAFPTFTLKLALGQAALAATPTYTTIPPSKIRSIHLKRGKNSALEQASAGTVAIVLDNSLRDFDPTFTGSPYREMVLNDGAIAYWRLSDLTDEVGGFTLLNGGAAVSFVPGQMGNAVDLNGSTQYLRNASFTPALTGPVTVEAWVRPDVIGTNQRYVFLKGEAAFDWRLFIAPSGVVTFQFTSTAAAARTVTGTTVLAAGQWYHLVGTWDGTNLKIYVNGVENGTANHAGSTPRDSDNAIRIGLASAPNYFDGLGDEVAVYATALTPDQIANHYTHGTLVKDGYYPNIKPMVRGVVQATYNAVTYDLIHFYADGWPQSYSPPNDAEVHLRGTDGFKILARAELPHVYELELRTDGPAERWRLSETGEATVAVNVVTDRDGRYYRHEAEDSLVVLGEEGAIVSDPDTAVLLDYAGDGPAGYLVLPSSASITGTGPFSVEFWYRFKDSTFDVMSQWGTAAYNANTPYSVWRFVHDLNFPPQLWFDVRDQATGTLGSRARFTSAPDLSTGWHQIVGVRETDGTAKLYLNGALVATGPTNAPLDLPAGDVYVNNTGAENLPVQAAYFDEIAFYGSALTAARVTAHYTAAREAWGSHDSDARVVAVADVVGIPAADRSIGAGQSTLQAAGLGTSALEHLQAVDITENGRIFYDKQGRLRFIGRHELLKPPYTTPQAVFGDGSGELPYTPGLVYDYDDSSIRTIVRVSSQGQSTQVAEDATAVSTYGPTVLERTGTLYDNAGEMRDAADYLLTQYKDPMLRATTIEIKPQTDEANLYPQVLGRELADRITLKTRPQGIEPAISQDYLIEGMEMWIAPESMRVQWYLSPADTKPYWVVGTSALGVDTRLGF